MSWLTGRDEKESDVYANYDKVESVVSNIKSISSNQVEAARDAVNNALNQLNNVNGLAQYVGSVDAGAFNGVFESIASAIVQVGDQVKSKANDIKTYEESAWYEKLGSTFAMAGAKFGEGVLSVAEDIGDGVVSIAGWVAPKDSGFEKACNDFVKKELSHDAFNFYYKSDFAKKSTFTEDSGAAGAFKIAGATAGYLYLGGAVSGFAGEMKGANTATKAVKTFASSTTKVNTTTAFLSGMGSGTESGIRQGKSFDDAAKGGFKQGVVQGGIAYGMGKLGEKSAQKAKDKAITEAQDKVNDASKKLSKAEDNFNSIKTNAQNLQDDVLNGKVLGSKEDVIKQAKTYAEQGRKAQDEIIKLSSSLDDAEQALNSAKNIQVQGYNDAITKAGQKSGARYAQNIAENGFVKGTVKSVVTDPVKAGVASAKSLGGKAVNTFKRNPGTALSTTVDGSSSSGSTALSTTVDGASSSGSTVANTAKNTKLSLKEAGAKVVKNVATSPSAPGVIGAGVNATVRVAQGKNSQASEQFKASPKIDSSTEDSVKVNSDVNYTPGKKPTVKATDNSSNSNSSSGGGSTGGSSGGGGGSSSGGGSYSKTVSSGGGSTSKVSGTVLDKSTEQFKKKDTEEVKPIADGVNNAVNNVTPTNPTNPTNPGTTTPGGNNTGNTIVTKPSNPGTTTTKHTGGGYSGSGGYRGGSTSNGGGYSAYHNSNNTTSGVATNTPDTAPPIDDVLDNSTASIDDVIKGSKYTKIPTSSKPITTTSASGSGGSAVIPVVAGLSAAAAAGIGAKVYMDRKKNNENGEYDEIDTEEWAGEDTINLDYDDSSDTETYLDDDDDYGYQAEEQTERYDARNNEELADLQ